MKYLGEGVPLFSPAMWQNYATAADKYNRQLLWRRSDRKRVLHFEAFSVGGEKAFMHKFF